MLRLIIFFIVAILVGCQVKPTLTTTPDFSEDTGRFYLHHVKGDGVPSKKKTQVFIDEREITDLDKLDKSGVVQVTGEHELEFKGQGALSGISEIDYQMNKGQNLHLYYCEQDGSFHWIANPANREQIMAEGKRLCQKKIKR